MRRKCLICEKVKKVEFVAIDGSPFCSFECLGKYWSLSRTCDCNYCGKEITDFSKAYFRYPDRWEHKIVYCSQDCLLKALPVSLADDKIMGVKND